LTYGGNANRGQIIIKAESIKESNEDAFFKMSWQNVNNVVPGCLGMCPEDLPVYIKISRSTATGDFVEEYRSQTF